MKEGLRRFFIDKQAYYCPRSLEQCDVQGVEAVLKYQYGLSLHTTALERTAAKVSLLISLTNVKIELLNKLTAGQVQRLLSMIVWAKEAKITEKKPFHGFDFKGIRYILPAEYLSDTSAIELAMCTIHQLAFGREMNPNLKSIFTIIATICRPVRADLDTFRKSKDWSGDEREEYNSRIAEERAVLFEGLPYGVCKAIFDYWTCMTSAFWKRYENLLDETEEEPMYLNGEGQITMLMDIAEMSVFGNFETVCKQNVHTIYIFLKDKKLKAERMERQLLKNTEDE